MRYPVVCHLLDTAAMVRELWSSFVSPGSRAWLADQLGLDEAAACRLVELIAGLHDLGKIMLLFQALDTVPTGYPAYVSQRRLGHAEAGRLWLGTALQDLGATAATAHRLAEVVGGHHGIFDRVEPLTDFCRPVPDIGDGEWEEQRRLVLESVYGILNEPSFPQDIPATAAVLICGIVVLADWLASQVDYIKSRLPEVPSTGSRAELAAFFAGSVSAAADVVAGAGLRGLRLRPGTFAEEFGRSPRPIQASIEQRLPGMAKGPGLLVITDRPGEGKTEIALHAARILGEAAGTNGLYFALPTMATADQMHGRLKAYVESRALDDAPLSLLHSMAWLSPVYTTVSDAAGTSEVSSHERDIITMVTDWMRGAKKAMFAPVCVGTIDQALLSVLPVRHNCLRLLGLAGKTVIIDEVHAYDAYTRGLAAALLRWLGKLGVPVVLMSATLPTATIDELVKAYLDVGRRRRKKMAPPVVHYPGWIYVDGPSRMVEPVAVEVLPTARVDVEIATEPVQVVDGKVDRMGALRKVLSPLLTEPGSAAVICTTVEQAQQTRQDLAAWLHGQGAQVELTLLHSRLPAHQRESVTAKLVATFGPGGDRSQAEIIVSTQVIEQSLDVDVDVMVSDLAPFELLIQRSGRCRRHRDNDAGRPSWAKSTRLVVLTAPETAGVITLPAAWGYVYPPAMLIRSQRLLKRYSNAAITIPEQVQDLVDTIYDDESLIAGYENAEIERLADDLVRRAEARRGANELPKTGEDLSSLTRSAVEEERISTRFDADSERVLPVFEARDGERYLDAAMTKPLPTLGGRKWFTAAEQREVINHTMPLRYSYIADHGAEHEPPADWCDDRYLKRLVLLVQRMGDDGEFVSAAVGDRRMHLDPMLGLVIG
ncbi:CRISPR-associated endonuclease/helicase Cas3 [Phytomonospora endophytica]|uniref:CRISPR-associated endonuclease/helicase Cas3 n=1 Tax=Phytomonospora endophytica TaxID=714109 RepID=A0A841FTE4_9ACTN|nr:CRISPR-associated endonuclease/helicase Cas3 [Phytomonospora endophytica]GIG70550.1 hypothetical protein Pen01_68450 [Phytomonospora endophytica]